MKSPTPTQPIDALIGDKEHNENQKKEEKGRNRERVPNPATLDPLVVSKIRMDRINAESSYC